MSTTSIELYNALVDSGIEKGRAERVAQIVVSKEDAQNFATKADIVDVRSDLRVQTARITIVIALNVGILAAVLATFIVG